MTEMLQKSRIVIDDLGKKNEKLTSMLQKSKIAIDDLKQQINNKDNQMQKLRSKAKEGLTFSQNKISELEKAIEVYPIICMILLQLVLLLKVHTQLYLSLLLVNETTCVIFYYDDQAIDT